MQQISITSTINIYHLHITCNNFVPGGKQRIKANTTFQSLSNWTTIEKTVGHISAFSKEDSVHYYTPGQLISSSLPQKENDNCRRNGSEILLQVWCQVEQHWLAGHQGTSNRGSLPRDS